jgi:SAM-dependent methyltransferase
MQEKERLEHDSGATYRLLKELLMRARLRMRKLTRDKTVNNYLKKPSMRVILECQAEVAALDPYPEYLSYRKGEFYFWVNIPQWIYEDSATRKIEKCLDVGCAYGTLSLYCRKLIGCDVYCIDGVDSYHSKSLFEKYNLQFRSSNIELDPFPFDFKFDIIILTEVLEHFNYHPVPTLKKIHNALSENGTLYLSTPDASQWGRVTKFYSKISDMPIPRKGLPVLDTMFEPHVYQYQKQELLSVLDAAGFRVKRFKYSMNIFGTRHFNLALMKKQ